MALALWKILKGKRTRLSGRLKIILYLLVQPNNLLNTIDNLIKIYHKIKKLGIDIVIFMIYIDALMSIIVFLEMFFYRKNYIKRKNLA